jgi:hypothetical protein
MHLRMEWEDPGIDSLMITIFLLCTWSNLVLPLFSSECAESGPLEESWDFRNFHTNPPTSTGDSYTMQLFSNLSVPPAFSLKKQFS